MKHCIKCGILKEITEYHITNGNKDGHQNTCKECTIKRVKEYRRLNLDKIKKTKIKWSLKNRKHLLRTSKN